MGLPSEQPTGNGLILIYYQIAQSVTPPCSSLRSMISPSWIDLRKQNKELEQPANQLKPHSQGHLIFHFRKEQDTDPLWSRVHSPRHPEAQTQR